MIVITISKRQQQKKVLNSLCIFVHAHEGSALKKKKTEEEEEG